MSRKTTSNSLKSRSGLEMRAQRDSRAVVTPQQEAEQQEALLLKGIGGAQQAFDWIVEHDGWALLGYESIAAWWAERVRPVMLQLEMRPTAEMVDKLLAKVREAERALPPAQRHKQSELAQLALASDWRVRDRIDTRKRRSAAGGDLEETSAGSGEPADQADQVGAGNPEHSATGFGDAAYVAEPEGDGDSPPIAVPTQPSGESVQEIAPEKNTPAGQVDSPPQVVGRPGLETPAAPPVAMQPDDPDAGSNQSGEDLPSSPDTQNPFTEWVWDLLDVIGRKPDPDDGADANADLFDALVNAAADLEDFLSDVRVVRTTDPMPTPAGAA